MGPGGDAHADPLSGAGANRGRRTRAPTEATSISPERGSRPLPETDRRCDVTAIQEEFSFQRRLFPRDRLSSVDALKHEFNIFTLRQIAPGRLGGQGRCYSLPGAVRS